MFLYEKVLSDPKNRHRNREIYRIAVRHARHVRTQMKVRAITRAAQAA